MTVTVLPYARSPYGRILLYTPTYSRHFTIASGVQGMMDLTIPSGGTSPSIVEVASEPTESVVSRDSGFKNRMLDTPVLNVMTRGRN